MPHITVGWMGGSGSCNVDPVVFHPVYPIPPCAAVRCDRHVPSGIPYIDMKPEDTTPVAVSSRLPIVVCMVYRTRGTPSNQNGQAG